MAREPQHERRLRQAPRPRRRRRRVATPPPNTVRRRRLVTISASAIDGQLHLEDPLHPLVVRLRNEQRDAGRCVDEEANPHDAERAAQRFHRQPRAVRRAAARRAPTRDRRSSRGRRCGASGSSDTPGAWAPTTPTRRNRFPGASAGTLPFLSFTQSNPPKQKRRVRKDPPSFELRVRRT